MKIAIDVDGCITNTNEVDFATCWIYNQKVNPDDDTLYENNHHNAHKIFGLDDVMDDDFYIQQRRQVIEENLMRPMIYADKVISQLFDEGHEIVILSSRIDSYWGNAKRETEKWLKQYGIKYSKCVCNCSNKGDYCKKNHIDVLVDDNPGYVKGANEQGVMTILLLASYNKHYKNPLNKFASCWPEVYKKINQINKALRDIC